MPLVYLTAAWLAGLAVAALLSLPPSVWGLWVVLPAGLLLIWRHDPAWRRVHLLALVFVLAALRYSAALPHFDEACRAVSSSTARPLPLACWNDGGDMLLEGLIAEPPDVRDRSTYAHMAVTHVRVDDAWQSAEGLALVEMPRETEVRYGDRVQVYGEPATPSESPDFSYKDYLARQGVYSVVRTYGGGVRVLAREQGDPFHTALYAFQARGAATLRAIMPEPAASLLVGILLGNDSGLPRELADSFRTTNTAHIIAISGFNIAVLVGLVSQLAQRLIRRRGLATLVVIASVVLYTLLVGASASVVRAAIAGSLSVLALYFRRQSLALNTLAVSAWVMTAQNPLAIFDLGFQLSFLATLGLILYVGPLTQWSERGLRRFLPADHAARLVALAGDSLLVTLAAQITTLPLVLFVFHRLSLVGPLTNLLILPAQPPLMVWGGAAMLAGMIAHPVGQLLGWIAWAFAEWTIRIVQATAAFPLAAVDTAGLDATVLALYYAVLLGATRVNWGAVWNELLRLGTLAQEGPAALGHALAAHPASARLTALALGGGVVVLVTLGNIGGTLPDGKTHVVFVDAGGAATFVRAPNGARLLIDGGANPSATLATLGERLPFWERSLDLLVLTNPDDAHLAGLVAALERYDVRQIVQVHAPAKPAVAYSKWAKLIADKRIATCIAEPGVQVALDTNLVLEIVDAGESNPTAVARLRTGHLSILFADSASEDQQAVLLESAIDPRSTVLVVPHSAAPEFLDAVNPQFAIVFPGSSTRAPVSAEALSTLTRATVLRVAERGTVVMVVDGGKVAVR